MLRIVFASHARRQFEKIREHEIRDRIARALETIAVAPL